MKKNYLIPYRERFIDFENNHCYKKTLTCIDGLGIVVYHGSQPMPTDEQLRRYLIGITTRYTFIQAENFDKALEIFNNYPESKMGERSKAWSVETSERTPAIEYCYCEALYYERGVNCHFYSKVNGLYCVLDNVDEPPLKCPINRQMKQEGWRKTIVEKSGQWVQVYEKIIYPTEVN